MTRKWLSWRYFGFGRYGWCNWLAIVIQSFRLNAPGEWGSILSVKVARWKSSNSSPQLVERTKEMTESTARCSINIKSRRTDEWIRAGRVWIEREGGRNGNKSEHVDLCWWSWAPHYAETGAETTALIGRWRPLRRLRSASPSIYAALMAFDANESFRSAFQYQPPVGFFF